SGTTPPGTRRLLTAYARCQPTRGGEFRGVWCHSAYGVSGMTWDRAIRHLKQSGFNAVVPNMLWGGVADYQSKLLPVRSDVATRGDQIALCTAAGRKYGVEVHVWKVNFNLQGAPKEFVDRMRAEGRLQATDRGEEEAWLCPSHPANFALERDSMLEVARNYDVDGIHFDYIRYPDQSKCYCDGCRVRFEESTGITVLNWPKEVTRGGKHFAAYQEFRRRCITRLVKAVSEEAHRLKPTLKVSAAVFSDWPNCREHVGQDWGHWVKQGYLDFVCPMDYTAHDEGFRARVQVQRDEVAGRIPLYPGVGAAAPGLPLNQVIDQIQIARAEGADGFIIFDYNDTVAHEYVPALGQATTRGTTYIPHNAPKVQWTIRQGDRPVAKAIPAGQPVQVEARVAGRVSEVVVSTASLDGKVVRGIGRARGGAVTIKGGVRLPAGLYRLIARGQTTPAGGKPQPFVARGPFLRVEK
ncbi:MAG: family 10 glycosylhydrolase, partial [Armatimonadetes bacterium]|nr:family 10 glycosylhydrolase [Armatimonadota bacterium]